MQAVTFFKALSNPTRLKLIYLLRNNKPLCVCELTDTLQQPQPTVSRHLNHLKRIGILSSERRGTWMWYQISDTIPKWCKHIIDTIEIEANGLEDIDILKNDEGQCC